MSITKEIIKYNNNDMNLKIRLGSNDAFTGYQQEIDSLTEFTTTELINPIIDGEMRRFKHFTNASYTLQFQFYNNILATYGTSFLNAGFTTDELTSKSNNVLNSFFILEYYDSYDVYNQNKIFSSYLTKIVTTTNQTPVYTINPTVDNQFYRWYVPISYIDTFTGNTATGYTKFSFYNAKRGKVQLFFNLDNISLTTSEKMYFKTILNFQNKTWKIISPSQVITARELQPTINQSYIDKINDTFDNFDNVQQNYPSGNTFNYQDGTYLTT
jgi:hypothetical protein